MTAGDRRVFVYPPGQGARVIFTIALTLGLMPVVLVTMPLDDAFKGRCILGFLAAMPVPAFVPTR